MIFSLNCHHISLSSVVVVVFLRFKCRIVECRNKAEDITLEGHEGHGDGESFVEDEVHEEKEMKKKKKRAEEKRAEE